MIADDKIKFEETQRQWIETLCWQCARLQVNDFAPYCSDKCKQRAAIEAEIKLADIGPKDTPLATAKKDAEVLVRQDKIKLWAKYVNHQYAAQAALFELITGLKPPKMKEMAAIISGH